MALGAFWFSIMSLLVKLAGQRLPSIEIVLVRAMITLALSIAMLQRARIPVWGKRRRLLAVRGLFGFVALTAFYFSVIHLPLAEATVIQYVNPVFAAVLATWLLGERLGIRELVCIAVGLIGVVLVARPAVIFGHSAALDPRYLAVALMGALFSAAAYVSVRQLGRTEHPLVVVFYFPLVTVPLALPFALVGWIWPTPMEWLILLGIGVSTQAGQLSITRGLQMEPAGRATAVGYLQIVFAAVWGALFFREFPGVFGIVGAVLIAGSTLWLLSGRQAGRQGAPPASRGSPMADREEERS
jgi:drug/metabolite transporter (DMT)-like permease